MRNVFETFHSMCGSLRQHNQMLCMSKKPGRIKRNGVCSFEEMIKLRLLRELFLDVNGIVGGMRFGILPAEVLIEEPMFIFAH